MLPPATLRLFGGKAPSGLIAKGLRPLTLPIHLTVQWTCHVWEALPGERYL